MTERSFTDNAGRRWVIAVDVPAIERVRELAGVNLTGLADDDFALLARLADDPVCLVNTLYVLCQRQADAAGVSDEDFGRALVGDAIEHGCYALLDAIADFLPPGRGRALRALVAKARQAADLLCERVAEGLEKLNVAALAADESSNG